MPAPAHQHPRTQHPVELIRSAVLWARASGITVYLATSWSVHCGGKKTPKWSLYPRARGVDPISAAILHYQPEAEEPYEAAAECLFAPVEWIRAFELGLLHENMPETWATELDVRLRLAGYEAGCRFREEFLRTRPARAV